MLNTNTSNHTVRSRFLSGIKKFTFLFAVVAVAFTSHAQNTWIQKADFGGLARYGAVGFSIADKGYLGTGYIGSYKKDFWQYDPATNTWTQKADFGGTTRYGAIGFSIADKGYLGAGYDGNLRKDFWEYDPATLDTRKYAAFVMERLMERGSWEAMQWLLAAFSGAQRIPISKPVEGKYRRPKPSTVGPS